MESNELVRRIAQCAMSKHHILTEANLAGYIGCSPKTIKKMLDESTVQLTQDQWFNLCALAGVDFRV